MLSLTRTLSKKFRSTNIQMLSAEQETRIEECFRDENLWLLNTYCGSAKWIGSTARISRRAKQTPDIRI
jgi:hypothetical protein